MNIVFHCADYPPVASGVGSYIRDMSRALAAAGHAVTVVTARAPGMPLEETSGGVAIRRAYDRSACRAPATAALVLSIAHEAGADVIEGADHLGECADLLAVRRRPPVLIKAHSSNGLDVLNASEALYGWQRLVNAAGRLRVWPQCRAEAASVRGADMLLTPSLSMMTELQRQGIPLPARRAVVPNPVIPAPAPPCGLAERPVVLFVGRLNFGKGIHVLPPLLERLRARLPESCLEIAGPDGFARGIGSTRRWMERRFGAHAGHVLFHGALYGDALEAAYARAWVVVVPSRWDNFPQVVLEAMARQKPVVASMHGGMPEMLAGTGHVVADPDAPAFADAVLAFLGDEDRRKRAGCSGFERVKSAYTPERVAGLYAAQVSEWLRQGLGVRGD